MRALKDKFLRQMRLHKVGLICFAFLALYEWLIVNNGMAWSVNPVTYSLYAFDYSMGFCTRILPGATYKALAGIYDVPHVSAFVSFFFLLLLGLLACFMERFFAAAAQRDQKTALVLMFFFLTGPFTFSIFVREFGLLDFYWVFFCAVAVLLLPRKRLKWLIPVCIFGMFLIHFAAIFCCAAVVLALLFFFAAKAEDRAEKREYYCLFTVCFLLTIGCAWYFIQHDLDNVVYSAEEFNEILRQRNVELLAYPNAIMYRQSDDSLSPPDYYFKMYHVDPGATGITRFVQWIISYIYPAIGTPQRYSRLLFIFLLELPAAALMIGILVSYFKAKRGDRFRRCSALLMILLFFGTTAVGFLLSSDTVRWIDHAFIDLCVCAFAVLYFDYREGFRAARSALRRIGFPALAVYALIYGLVIIDPYLQY